MRVQTLHTPTGASDTSRWPRTFVVGRNRGFPFLAIATVRFGQHSRVDRRLGCPHSPLRLEAPDGTPLPFSHQPEQGWHGSPVVEDRSVAENNGIAGVVSHDDLERSPSGSAEQLLDPLAISR